MIWIKKNDQQVQDFQRNFAIDLFNATWDFIEKEDRNQTEYEAMARAAKLAAEKLQSQKCIALAKEVGAKIKELDDQKYFFGERKKSKNAKCV